jgi:RNA-binding motif X-linked protein 2
VRLVRLAGWLASRHFETSSTTPTHCNLPRAMSREVTRLNLSELESGVSDAASWHQDYKDTAWVFVGNLSTDLVEGDVLCVFSQFGEVEDLTFPREDKTGKPKGFCFLKFEDWRSAVLTVDNFNDAELLGRKLRVDHHRPSEKQRPSKGGKGELTVEDRLAAVQPGRAFADKELQGPYDFFAGVDVFANQKAQVAAGAGGVDWRARPALPRSEKEHDGQQQQQHRAKKSKKDKKSKDKKKRHKAEGDGSKPESSESEQDA